MNTCTMNFAEAVINFVKRQVDSYKLGNLFLFNLNLNWT